MQNLNKPIRLSRHAKEQLAYRGGSEEELFETIRTSKWGPAERGRLECQKDFPYHKAWNDKHYRQKQIKPIFVDEETEIVIVTVYVYYF